MIFMCAEHHIFVLETETGWHKWEFCSGGSGMTQHTYDDWNKLLASRPGNWVLIEGRRGHRITFEQVKTQADWLKKYGGFGDNQYNLLTNNCFHFVQALLGKIVMMVTRSTHPMEEVRFLFCLLQVKWSRSFFLPNIAIVTNLAFGGVNGTPIYVVG